MTPTEYALQWIGASGSDFKSWCERDNMATTWRTKGGWAVCLRCTMRQLKASLTK